MLVCDAGGGTTVRFNSSVVQYLTSYSHHDVGCQRVASNICEEGTCVSTTAELGRRTAHRLNLH